MDRLTVLFASTTLALGAASAWLVPQLFSERRHAALLAERVAVLESALDRASGRPRRGADSPAADNPGQSGIPAASDAFSALPEPKGTRERLAQFRINEAELLRSPQYRERWLAMMTLNLERTYTDLKLRLGLSDTEYAEFLATMAQFELEQTLRNYEVPLETGLDPAGRLAASRQQLADTQSARRQALRDLLGEARYRQWIDYQRTAQGREELERWRIEFAVAGQPLTPGQSQDLLPILVEHQRRTNALPNDGALAARALANPAGASRGLVETERRIASQAEINAWLGDALSGVLTIEQRDLVIDAVNREVEISRAQLELTRLRLDAGSP